MFRKEGLQSEAVDADDQKRESLFAEHGVTVEGIADLKFDRPQGSRGTDSSGRGAGIHRLQEGRSIKTSMKWKKQESAPPKG